MKFLRTISLNLGILKDFFSFLVRRKLVWSVPLMLLILCISFFLFFGQTTGLAAFIYPLF